eukprot:COSAG02_NODE_236_length_27740_cov_49.156073_11_plen_70_part_00
MQDWVAGKLKVGPETLLRIRRYRYGSDGILIPDWMPIPENSITLYRMIYEYCRRILVYYYGIVLSSIDL